jgi:hypothetical protein
MRTSKGSSKKGTGRTIDMKRIDTAIPQDNCGYTRYPIEGHPAIRIGMNANGEYMFYCELCKHIVGALS